MIAIGTQMRDPINSGLTRWRMGVLNKQMDAVAELGRIPSVSIRFSLSMEMSRLTRDGIAEPVSRDQILRRKRGQGNINFPCSADHEQNWQPYPVDPYSCYMCDHIIGEKPIVILYTYINRYAGTPESHLNVMTFIILPDWGLLRRSRCVQIFL